MKDYSRLYSILFLTLLVLASPSVMLISIDNAVDMKSEPIKSKSHILSLLEHDPILISSNEDFVSQGWPGAGTFEDPYVIADLEIISNGSSCLRIGPDVSAHYRISGCTFSDARSMSPPSLWGILIEGGFGTIIDCIVRNCTFGLGLFSDYSVVTNCDVQECSVGASVTGTGNILSDCIIGNCTASGLTFTDADRCVIQNTLFPIDPNPLSSTAGFQQMHIENISNCIIRDNEIYSSNLGMQIDGRNVSLQRNTYHVYSDGGAIYLCSGNFGCSDNITITDSIFIGQNFGYAIKSIITNNVTISNCEFRDKWAVAVYLSGNGNYTISNCMFSTLLTYGTLGTGISDKDYIDFQSWGVIKNNTLQYFSKGIEVFSNHIQICNNTISNNTKGIVIHGNESNVFYNNFVQNNIHAEDNGENNLWDDDVGLGNFWDNYDGEGPYEVNGTAGAEDRWPVRYETTTIGATTTTTTTTTDIVGIFTIEEILIIGIFSAAIMCLIGIIYIKKRK